MFSQADASFDWSLCLDSSYVILCNKNKITKRGLFTLHFVFFFHFAFNIEIAGSFYHFRIPLWWALQEIFIIAFAILFFVEMCF